MVNLNYSLNSLVTKIKSWNSSRLNETIYDALTSCKTDDSFFKILCESRFYSKKIESLSGILGKNILVDNILRGILINTIKNIIKYEKILGGTLFNYLKDYIDVCFVASNLDRVLTSDVHIYSENFFKSDFYGNTDYYYTKSLLNLKNVNNLHDFFEVLCKSRFSKLCRDIDLTKDNSNTIAIKFQQKLYESLYNRLLLSIKNISSEISKKKLYEIFSCYLELKSFEFIIRSKKSSIDFERILPKFHNYKKTFIESLKKASIESDFFKFLENSHLKKDLKKDTYAYIEQISDFFLLNKCEKIIKFSSNSESVILSYLYLLEIEIQNLIKVAEGIRLNLPKNKILELLIF